jgi:hypothetical protein
MMEAAKDKIARWDPSDGYNLYTIKFNLTTIADIRFAAGLMPSF